jgi:hypothetical protein
MNRKVRLMIVDGMISCASKLNIRNSFHSQLSTAQDLVDDMAASACFHLCADVPDLVRNAESGAPFRLTPGKSLGGLLFMHPLFIVSSLSITKTQQRHNMRNALVWIADRMGIGQARSLLTVSLTQHQKSYMQILKITLRLHKYFQANLSLTATC